MFAETHGLRAVDQNNHLHISIIELSALVDCLLRSSALGTLDLIDRGDLALWEELILLPRQCPLRFGHAITLDPKAMYTFLEPVLRHLDPQRGGDSELALPSVDRGHELLAEPGIAHQHAFQPKLRWCPLPACLDVCLGEEVVPCCHVSADV